MFSLRPSSPAISSQYLLFQAQAYEATENTEEAKKWYQNAVAQAKTEHERNRGDQRAKINFDTIRQEYFTFLSGLQEPDTTVHSGEQSPTSPSPNQLNPVNGNDVPTQQPLSVQRAQDAAQALSSATQPSFFEKRSSSESVASVVPSASRAAQELPTASSVQEKSTLVDYLFTKTLLTLERLDISKEAPSLFLVYAHDNPQQGQANAHTSKYFIEKLSTLKLNLYSDQTPTGQPCFSTPTDDGKIEDVLTNQLCLLPTELGHSQPVNKVIVCCSEVLANYLKQWGENGQYYEAYRNKLEEAYHRAYEQRNDQAMREVVKEFSQKEPYRAGFHHVLTEIAFLQIRINKLGNQHGIIPVSLTQDGYGQCLKSFIETTTVRIEDIPRFEEQAQQGKEIYPNQGRHWALFKLIERLLTRNYEARMLFDKFWNGYSNFIFDLKDTQSPPNAHDFAQRLDDIFGEIETELHRKLATTVQRVHQFSSPNLSSIDLRKALYKHYQGMNLSIQRVSGSQESLADCYINLAIVESQAQQKKDKDELKKQAVTFERLPSSERQRLEATNPNKLIALEKLFEKQKLRDGSEGIPKRILIQGRAGIGKTTLCKKLVYEYHQNGLWQEQFESVLWVPLRHLKTHAPKRLDDLLCTKYFINQESSEAQALSKVFHAHKDKVLFILDGLDEVVGELNEGGPLNDFLQMLLNQTHVVITSRPAGVDTKLLGQLDLELETVGFSPDNVQAYIEKYVPASNQAEIQQFIHSTPLIQGLVNIPIQLDALCYSWDKLPQNKAVTMAMLYEAMVDKLWRKDSVRLEKKEEGTVLGVEVIESLTKSDLEELMTAEIHYLGYLAFKGLEAEKIEFSLEELSQRRKELNERSQTGGKLPFNFTTNLKKTSYLHTADIDRLESERHYHFLHLTFQEFFAAKFLVKHLQAYTNVERTSIYTYGVQKNLDVMPMRHDVEMFIATHKYHPRYEIVWWMVAGLLKGAALENFFNVLNQSPQDLIGIRHQQVMVGCLNEARPELKEKYEIVETLETRLKQYFELEIKLIGQSQLGRHRLFPEHLLITSLSSDKDKDEIIRILRVRPNLSVNAILALIDIALKGGSWEFRKTAASILYEQKVLPANALQALIDASEDNDKDVRSAAVRTLGGQSTLSEVVVLALIGALKDQDSDVRSAAAHVLGGQSTLSEAVVLALIGALKDQNSDVRYAAAHGLEGQSTLSETIVLALISALKDQDKYVRSAVDSALRGQSTLSDTVILALINALNDQNWYGREAVVRALRSQGTLSEAVVLALIDALKDQDSNVRDAAASALVGQSTLSDAAVLALIDALNDQDEYVRSAAVRALRSQGTLSEAVILALIAALKDQNSNARYAAARALVGQSTLSEAIVLALIDALKDPHSNVRDAVVHVLSGQSVLSGAAVRALIGTLKDQDEDVRSAAVHALRGQSTLSDTVILALINALNDQNWYVRYAAASALIGQSTLSDTAVLALVDALNDQDEYVRSAVVRALRSQGRLSEAIVLALIDALKDQNSNVRYAAASALKDQSTLSEAIVLALIGALKDPHSIIRSAAVHALGGQSTLSEAIMLPLVDALKDRDSDVRSAVAHALGGQSTLSEAVVLALISALKDQDQDSDVRYAAASALGGQSTLSEAIVLALIDALKDQNSNVRSKAVLTLGGQSTLSEAIVLALIDALKDPHSNVRDAAVHVLRGQSVLSEAAVRALIGPLKDQNSNVRSAAVHALGGQSTLSEAAVRALIDALKDQDSNVRSEAIRALKEEELLPADAIATFITMLEDEDKSIKEMIIKILVKQKTLSTNVIQALITKLTDRDKSVRDAAVGILDLHIDQIYSMFSSLTSTQIQILYAKALFLQSGKQIMFLYSHDDRLYFYTKNGLKHTESMPIEKINIVVEAFETVRRNPEIIYVQESTSINAAAFSLEITNESDTNRVLGSNQGAELEISCNLTINNAQAEIQTDNPPVQENQELDWTQEFQAGLKNKDEPIDDDFFLEEDESESAVFSEEDELSEDED